MIKRFTLLVLFYTIFTSTIFAQFKSLNVGPVYSNHSRSELDKYVDFFTAATGLPAMAMANAYGVSFSVSSGNGSIQGIFGGSYTYGLNSTVSSDKLKSLVLKQGNFNLNFGLDKYIVPWFFVGGQFLVTSFSGKTKYKNTGDPSPSDTLIGNTGDNSNIFLGYGIGIRGETGFYIPFKTEDSGVKIQGYYDLGLSKYNFYDSFDKVITSYTGDKKTMGNAFGVQLLFAIPMGR